MMQLLKDWSFDKQLYQENAEHIQRCGFVDRVRAYVQQANEYSHLMNRMQAPRAFGAQGVLAWRRLRLGRSFTARASVAGCLLLEVRVARADN